MTIEYFQLFVEVYRARGFAEVAKKRNVAPSSITRSIALLEENLGFRLFHRTTRKVSPTEEGKKLFYRITDWLEDFDSIRTEVQNIRENPSGNLRITTNVSFNQIFLVGLVPQFQSLYPKINLEILITDSVVDMLEERIDIAIRFGKLNDSDFTGVKLFDLEYVLVASPEYLKHKGTPHRLENLVRYDCLSFLLNQFHSVWKFERDGKIQSIKINPKIRVTGALSLIEYTKGANGLALLPKALIRKELENGDLIQILKSYRATPTEFGSAAWLVFPARKHLPKRTRVFIDFMRSHIWNA